MMQLSHEFFQLNKQSTVSYSQPISLPVQMFFFYFCFLVIQDLKRYFVNAFCCWAVLCHSSATKIETVLSSWIICLTWPVFPLQNRAVFALTDILLFAQAAHVSRYWEKTVAFFILLMCSFCSRSIRFAFPKCDQLMTNPTAFSYHFQSHVWEFDQPPDLTLTSSAFLEVTAVLKIGKRRSLQARGKNKTN